MKSNNKRLLSEEDRKGGPVSKELYLLWTQKITFSREVTDNKIQFFRFWFRLSNKQHVFSGASRSGLVN